MGSWGRPRGGGVEALVTGLSSFHERSGRRSRSQPVPTEAANHHPTGMRRQDREGRAEWKSGGNHPVRVTLMPRPAFYAGRRGRTVHVTRARSSPVSWKGQRMHGENQSGAKLNTSLLVRGAILFGLGGVLAGIGMLIGAVAVSSAARNWVRQLDTPPSETAKSVAKRLSAAGSAGCEEPFGCDERRCQESFRCDERRCQRVAEAIFTVLLRRHVRTCIEAGPRGASVGHAGRARHSTEQRPEQPPDRSGHLCRVKTPLPLGPTFGPVPPLLGMAKDPRSCSTYASSARRSSRPS